MSLPESDNHKLQKNYKTELAISALKEVIAEAGFDAADLQVALGAIASAKELSLKQSDYEYKFFIDRTLIYEDHDAFMFQRADSKSGRWYLRIYDEKKKKPVIRSLRTSDKTTALSTARLLYIEIKGKIDRGERLKSITAVELVNLWDKKLRDQITDIPHQGIVEKSYAVKRYFLDNWMQYIEYLRLSRTPIDRIEPQATRDFGTWLKQLPKKNTRHKGERSLDIINNNIVEVRRMYKDLALRDRYLSSNQLPQIDKLKVQRDLGSKRDILSEEQYEKLWKYIQFNYITKKHNPAKPTRELETRKIWKEFIFIMSNVGFRPKELLGIKIHEISNNPNWDSEKNETDCLMKVRRENSKTGRARVCVAPVRKRIERILAAYKKIGITHQPDDYLFMNPKSQERKQYVREHMWNRLKFVLKDSGLQEELDIDGKAISLYSFRHTYACWRLRYGDVPIHLLAKQMGTSIQQIENTYGHIAVEKQADLITKAQEQIKRTGFVLNQPEVLDVEELVDNLQSNSHRYEISTVKINKQKIRTNS
ncbi:tyrosine-type recombinase/integrase [Prochlorococcus marinus]|uniref:tyrosine-type recombinase/integrase n=1 Tax=Prochlorococcus marinus TaxID=1219 RepID=UPI0022B38A07|nr:tyrosine-type recombinase/integrase [Prochlorococcus marinus]